MVLSAGYHFQKSIFNLLSWIIRTACHNLDSGTLLIPSGRKVFGSILYRMGFGNFIPIEQKAVLQRVNPTPCQAEVRIPPVAKFRLPPKYSSPTLNPPGPKSKPINPAMIELGRKYFWKIEKLTRIHFPINNKIPISSILNPTISADIITLLNNFLACMSCSNL